MEADALNILSKTTEVVETPTVKDIREGALNTI